MHADIIFDLAVEKIREDFGDFFGTVFQVLIIQRGCTIYELNKIIPNIDYNMLRFTLFFLFNHDVIFLDKINEKKNDDKISIQTVKIFANIYTPIYRIRFPRFLCIIEKEFGNIGREILKFFFEYGQIIPSRIVQELKKTKTWETWQLEDSLINLARDNYIERLIISEFCEVEHFSYIKKRSSFNETNFYKPICHNKNFLWKVSYPKLNSILKINMAICISEDYFSNELKSSIKSSFCRISGNCVKNILLNWFSIDTLIDYTKESIDEVINDELFIIVLIENYSPNQFILEMKNGLCYFRLENILDISRQKIIESFAANQFGKKLFRVFKTLNSCKAIDEDQIAQECIVDKKSIRKIIYQMYRMSFVFLDEKNRYDISVSSKSVLFWKLNADIMLKKTLFEIYKTMYNILVRLEDLKINLRKKNNLIKPNIKNVNLSQIDILRMSIFRLDEMLTLLE
nr:DNA-directed RNA polymerase III subunit C3 [Cryptomonas sp.]